MFPYFDTLFKKLNEGDTTSKEAFGEYVHWGYWDNPHTTIISAKDFHHAANLMTQHVVQKAQIKDGHKILDIGCGFGGTIKFLNERYSNCTMVGINIDPRQIVIAKNTVTASNGNQVEFIEADACKLPFTDQKFDVILCIESIFHFSNRQIFFEECRRILRPGGVLVVSDFVPIYPLGSFMNFIEHAFHLVDKVYGTMRIDVSIPKYKKMAKTTGFSVVDVDNITSHTFPTYKFLKQSFSEHLPESEIKFSRATTMIEYASRFGLLKYLILTFVKNDK